MRSLINSFFIMMGLFFTALTSAVTTRVGRVVSIILKPIMRRFLLTLLAALTLATTAHAAGLNDTGIDFCGDVITNTANCASVAADNGAYPRQEDARYGRDAAAAAGMPKTGGGGKGFDFSKIANNGTVLDAAAALGSGATDWACTRDNVTGLIWEVKTTSGLRSQSHTYTWYDSNPATNGGAVGEAAGGTCAASSRCDTEKFAADVNVAGLCGASDWRMPKVKELEGIADLGRKNPAIDPTYFPNTPSSVFWSGSSYAYYSNGAWFVNFGYGNPYYAHAYYAYRGYAYSIRLVRGGE